MSQVYVPFTGPYDSQFKLSNKSFLLVTSPKSIKEDLRIIRDSHNLHFGGTEHSRKPRSVGV